ncbi:MAG: ABC transporter permease [Desulfobacteraceae bacterium]|nr:ABC transporter permease [Desulfobacteraceae bacterium]MBC2755980.1 ABC transporter permease [Desulfobacteraceae bacterium]
MLIYRVIKTGLVQPSDKIVVRSSHQSILVRSGRALIGSLLARNLKVRVGDELTIMGQGKDGSVAAAILTVCGIYESGMDEFDRNTLHIPINTFQAVYSMESAVHEIIINVNSLRDVPMVKAKIINRLKDILQGNALVVMDWDELVPGLTQSIRIDLTMGIIFWFLLVVIVAFSILNTFLMAIFERTREFGVMMAIGTTPQRLVKLLLYESNFMTIVGVGLGILTGCGITMVFQIYGIDMSGSSEILKQYGMSGRIYPRLSIITAFAGPVLVWLITVGVALYPALKIKRLKPVEAMHHV